MPKSSRPPPRAVVLLADRLDRELPLLPVGGPAEGPQPRVAGRSASTGSPTSGAAVDGLHRWVGLFGTAARRAAAGAEAFEEQVAEVQESWRARLGSVRRSSAADLLLHALPGAPLVMVNGAARLIGRTFQATNQAISRLAEAGVLTQVNVGRRNRALEAPELIRQFTDLERRLASPTGDTHSSEPSRRAPRRPSSG